MACMYLIKLNFNLNISVIFICLSIISLKKSVETKANAQSGEASLKASGKGRISLDYGWRPRLEIRLALDFHEWRE